ncbi:hypothetical protein T440DRAFT_491385 [Plenodomus tracheiphilus IPT5]|uniref:SH3 domain-containing protein n=1 Tax=Plenodomus tracheiphilus IPT5 TaxID=1408161 RepID=A0A6A7B1Q6_9PLEO|nr:hypothetical protein T440DRAFT_491385 [Plenodomus tracheiphilus IPT5]
MAHQHGQAHIVRRQRFRQEEDVTTVVEVKTEVNGGDTRTLVPPAVRPRPKTSTSTEDDETTTEAPTSTKRTLSTATSTSKARKPTPTQESSDVKETARTSIKEASTLMVATKEPIPSAASTATAGLASVTAAISATASAAADAKEEGMSTGAKAGLALGVLLAFCAILTGILLIYRRKKKQMAAAQAENEKIDLHNAAPPPPPQIHVAAATAPSIRTNRTASTAPRLSLRPVTQFDPAFNDQNKSGGNLLNVAAAGGAAAQAHNRGQSDERPSSSWESPGAVNAPTANPFNDPEGRSGPPSANPFGNSAAVEPHHAGIPDSPPNNSPLHSTQPSKDFANPGRAIAAAELSAGPMSSQSNEFPAPPPKSANGSIAPASPARTEEFPASPGPAPTGALPVAGALAGSRPQSPAPGPDNVHRVQLDFKPSMQDELDLYAGQLVRMLHEYDDGWALCIRMDRSQQGVVPRTCLSKHPVKPRTGPPRQGPPPPGMRGPPIRSAMGPGGIPQPRPLSPGSGRNSPHPPSGRNSPGPRQMPPQHFPPQSPRGRSNSNAPNPQFSQPRQRSNSNGPMMAPPPQIDGRPRSNSASQAGARRGPAMGMSPMNPNANAGQDQGAGQPVVNRKPVPGMAI